LVRGQKQKRRRRVEGKKPKNVSVRRKGKLALGGTPVVGGRETGLSGGGKACSPGRVKWSTRKAEKEKESSSPCPIAVQKARGGSRPPKKRAWNDS